MSSTAGKWTDPSITRTVDSFYCTILCQYCGSSHHPEACSRVKSIEYYPNGRIKKVELHLYEYNLDPPFKTSITFTGYEEVA